MRILVIGGAGYIGSHTARILKQRGHEVIVLDNMVFGHRDAVGDLPLIKGDLSDRALLETVFRECKIEAVIHFAAFAFVGESVTDPAKYYQNNLVNTLTLLDAMRACDVKRIVFSSTCATYGVPARVPIDEELPQDPINPYGRTKLAIEWALKDYSSAYGLGFAALRYFNAAGASPVGDIGEDHHPETHLIPLVLQVALGQRSHIEIYGTDYPTPDGTCIRDYIHVDDLAEAHALAAAKLADGSQLIYNLGTGHGYSVREVIDICREVTGKPISVKESPRRPGDPPVLVASAEKANRELGWKPRYPELRQIVETAWRWHESHPQGFAE
ncbi:MAG: UDP-glucose 4-epimerase GalE [Planctomycetota bacterium]|nr:UDP-glucose 4-epimerase GalE [Planctomycetota bacterium]